MWKQKSCMSEFSEILHGHINAIVYAYEGEKLDQVLAKVLMTRIREEWRRRVKQHLKKGHSISYAAHNSINDMWEECKDWEV